MIHFVLNVNYWKQESESSRMKLASKQINLFLKVFLEKKKIPICTVQEEKKKNL